MGRLFAWSSSPWDRSAVLVEVGGPAEALVAGPLGADARVAAVEMVPAASTVLFDGVRDVDAARGPARRLDPGVEAGPVRWWRCR